MLVTRQPVLKRFWYPTMPAGKLPADKPVPFRLLGQDIVLFRAAGGAPAALTDRCPHRAAALSLGFLDHDVPDGPVLACPYHGWAFGADGRCRKVPQAHEPLRGMTKGARAHHAAERHGWIWVALENPIADIPHIPEADDPGFRRIDEFHEAWPVSGLRFMENSFDMAHLLRPRQHLRHPGRAAAGPDPARGHAVGLRHARRGAGDEQGAEPGAAA
jgi:phenylpropionate dioxygenase-like ring-hydroxylating dioxygenase large terminal subunit